MTPKSCPLVSICMSWHGSSYAHTHTHERIQVPTHTDTHIHTQKLPLRDTYTVSLRRMGSPKPGGDTRVT